MYLLKGKLHSNELQVIYKSVYGRCNHLFCSFDLNTAQKLKFSIKDLFGKCDQIHRKLHFLYGVIVTIKENESELLLFGKNESLNQAKRLGNP